MYTEREVEISSYAGEIWIAVEKFDGRNTTRQVYKNPTRYSILRVARLINEAEKRGHVNQHGPVQVHVGTMGSAGYHMAVSYTFYK